MQLLATATATALQPATRPRSVGLCASGSTGYAVGYIDGRATRAAICRQRPRRRSCRRASDLCAAVRRGRDLSASRPRSVGLCASVRAVWKCSPVGHRAAICRQLEAVRPCQRARKRCPSAWAPAVRRGRDLASRARLEAVNWPLSPLPICAGLFLSAPPATALAACRPTRRKTRTERP